MRTSLICTGVALLLAGTLQAHSIAQVHLDDIKTRVEHALDAIPSIPAQRPSPGILLPRSRRGNRAPLKPDPPCAAASRRSTVRSAPRTPLATGHCRESLTRKFGGRALRSAAR